MIVIGADTHKRTHTLVATSASTGELIGERTVPARDAGFRALLAWARGLDGERVFAIEDCRHVSGGLERFLIARGERVLRIPPRLMAGARRAGRQRGKSDPIDALAVARAAIREGIERLPGAHLDPDASEIRLLVDHHDDLVARRTAEQGRLRWHLHDMWPELEIPVGGLDREVHCARVARRLARAPQTARVRVARSELASIRRATREIRALEREIAILTRAYAPELLHEPGLGPLTAARIISQVAGIGRFSSDAQLARLAGVAPIPASSGRTDRHRLDRGGDRKLNCALHRLAVNKGRLCPESAAYLARHQAAGKNRMEALRCLKRHLARRIFHLLKAAEARRADSLGAPTPGPALAPALT